MDLQTLVKSIGEPMRFHILEMLVFRKHCVRSLSKHLGISESAVSQHLKVMREAGLIYGEKYGYHTHYMPTPEAMNCLAEGFAAMRQKSDLLNREANDCHCKYGKEGHT